MKNSVIAHYTAKGGGTGTAWFDTNERAITDKLVRMFMNKFPEIRKINSITLSSKAVNPYNLLSLHSETKRFD